MTDILSNFYSELKVEEKIMTTEQKIEKMENELARLRRFNKLILTCIVLFCFFQDCRSHGSPSIVG